MFTRYRHITLLGVVLLAQLLLLAYQIRRPDAGGVRLLRLWSIRAVLPVARASHAAVAGVETMAHNYVFLRHARLQARTLAAELRETQVENLQLRAAVAENTRLNALLGFHPRQIERLLPAQIIGGSAALDSQVLYLNRGTADGVARNMPVLCPQGVVGKITQTFPHESEVLLITDPGSGVGAMVANSGGHGVLWGRGPGETALRFVSDHEAVHSGEAVVTSGEDQIFPAGLPLGTVTAASQGQPFWRIRVRPAAPIAELDDVLIATRLGPQPPPPPDAAALSAAAILSQKLPAIPREAFNPLTGPPARVPDLLAARLAEARARAAATAPAPPSHAAAPKTATAQSAHRPGPAPGGMQAAVASQRRPAAGAAPATSPRHGAPGAVGQIGPAQKSAVGPPAAMANAKPSPAAPPAVHPRRRP